MNYIYSDSKQKSKLDVETLYSLVLAKLASSPFFSFIGGWNNAEKITNHSFDLIKLCRCFRILMRKSAHFFSRKNFCFNSHSTINRRWKSFYRFASVFWAICKSLVFCTILLNYFSPFNSFNIMMGIIIMSTN